MPTQNAPRHLHAPVQIAAKRVTAATMNSAAYVSFIAIRCWTKYIPSRSPKTPARIATDRRRNRIRASRKSSPAMSAPAITPGKRQAKACCPMSTEAAAPSPPNTRSCSRSVAGWSGFTSAAHVAGWNGRRASAKTLFPRGSTAYTVQPVPSGVRPSAWTIWLDASNVTRLIAAGIQTVRSTEGAVPSVGTRIAASELPVAA